MSYAAFGRAHKPVCHFKLAGHPARVCRHLAELATQVWPAERPSGTIELPATLHIMHHAPCTMHHAPPHSVLHRTRCAMHHWRISPCARHCALCTTHPSAYHILDGAVPPFTARLSPPRIISELIAGPPVHCPRVHVRYDAVSRWDDCSCVRVRLLLVTSLVSLSWSIPVNELIFPFHCLSPRVLGILARSHASPGS